MSRQQSNAASILAMDLWETHESVHCNTVAQFKLVTTKMQTVFPGSPSGVGVGVGVCTLKDCL